tara:strand:- start:1282 stop:2079 length:798 start_codon:yes stop_codon:yes gene_type:complete
MVNVDSVYQTVQALANKEQRGYLTPQEFNLFANQAQQDIFEQYFYDLQAFRLRAKQLGIEKGGSTSISFTDEFEVGDSATMIREKLRTTTGVTYTPNMDLIPNGNGYWVFPVGRNGKIRAMKNGLIKDLKIINPDEMTWRTNSRYHRTSAENDAEWFIFEAGYNMIRVMEPSSLDGTGINFNGGVNRIQCENIQGEPGLVFWNFVIVNEKPIYNATTSSHFDLPREEQPDLVVKILKLAGISIEDSQLYQFAGAEEQQNLQQENK